jgi:dipeptidase D
LDWQTVLRQELDGVDGDVAVNFVPIEADRVMVQHEQPTWLRSLHAAPHGVRRMSRKVSGVVETSNNLGVVELNAEGGSCNFMVRSLRDSGSQELAAEIVDLFALSGTKAAASGQYPGWTPNPNSPLLALCQAVYEREFRDKSKVQVIHAGLECGIIAAKYPGLDIVSFGPTIRGAHAPGESVDIASVDRTWRLLTAILATIT